MLEKREFESVKHIMNQNGPTEMCLEEKKNK